MCGASTGCGLKPFRDGRILKAVRELAELAAVPGFGAASRPALCRALEPKLCYTIGNKPELEVEAMDEVSKPKKAKSR
jgi:hypothetical protein